MALDMNPHNAMRWLSLGLVLVLAGCAQPDRSLSAYVAQMKERYPERHAKLEAEQKLRDSQRTEVAYVSMMCITHGGARIGAWYVQEVAYGQITQAQVGGYFVCGGLMSVGYPLPRKWLPGGRLKVKVRWESWPPDAPRHVFTKPIWHEKYTTILPYDKPGTLYVHFFPGDEVRIVSSDVGASNPNHPIARDSRIPPPEVE